MIAELVATGAASLVPIDGPAVDSVRSTSPAFRETVLPAATYGTTEDVPTLSVGALWIVNANVSEERVYQITRALWQGENRVILLQSHSLGEQITLDRAVAGLPIPLHRGAERYYKELGLIGKSEGGLDESEPLGMEPAGAIDNGPVEEKASSEVTTN